MGRRPTISRNDVMSQIATIETNISLLKDMNKAMKFTIQLTALQTRFETASDLEEVYARQRPSASNVQPERHTKLKKLSIPSFSGDLKTWRAFWDRFLKNVDSLPDSEMSMETKFAYLDQALEGAARAPLSNLSLEAKNYENAKLILLEKYGDAEKLHNIYLNELYSLPTAYDGTTQRLNLESIKQTLFNLESLYSQDNDKLSQDNKLKFDILKNTILSKFSKANILKTLEMVDLIEDSRVSASAGGSISALSESSISMFRSITLYLDVLHKIIRNEEKADEIAKLAVDSPPLKRPCLAGALSATVKPTTQPSTTSHSYTKTCIFCASSGHRHKDCPTHKTLVKRQATLTSKGLCHTCLKPKHPSNKCPKKDFECVICKKTGHLSHMCVQHMIKTFSTKPAGNFLETFICLLPDHGRVMVRGVMDSCSQYSYIDKSLVQQLRIPLSNRQLLNLCLFATLEPLTIESGELKLRVCNVNETISKNLSFMVTPCITGDMQTSPHPDVVKSILPSDLIYADTDLFSVHKMPIQMIIGNNHQFDIFNGQIKRIAHALTLRNSFLGWMPTGEVRGSFPPSSPSSALLSLILSSTSHNVITKPFKSILNRSTSAGVIENDLEPLLSNLWSLEAIGIKTTEAEMTDDRVLEQFRTTVRFENNRYIVRWPWKHENPYLPSNYRMCIARLNALYRRSDMKFLEEYDTLIKEQLKSGIIEYAPKTTPFLTHYLPHRGLKKNNKLRIVYDGSAKTSNGYSLNQLMHKGPILMENLIGLLLNFRLYLIALLADIEKAFLQIGLNEVDRDCVRFIWLRDIHSPPDKNNLVIFRFARVPFGIIASPFLLNIVLQELLSSEPRNRYLVLAKYAFYIDNLVTSLPDVESAIDLRDILIKKMNAASFNLRDWTSNNEQFLESCNLPPLVENERISVLGLDWDRKLDVLYIKISYDVPSLSLQVTKRLALQYYASIFDPLGFLQPCTLRLKLFIQECWRNQFQWDEPLPASYVAKWQKIVTECSIMTNIPIPRRYWEHSDKNGTYFLHIFCDASKSAYACCAYLSYINTGTSTRSTSLIFSKTRAAPIKCKPLHESDLPIRPDNIFSDTSSQTNKSSDLLTIPKLELMAALIGKRISTFLTDQLKLSLDKTILWTDATTVLHWLNSTSVLPIFIRNRITEIRSKPNLIIRYVPSEQNPADIATRGETPSSLRDNDLWWHGPSWLCHESLWPSPPPNTQPHYTSTVTLVAGEAPKYKGILTDVFEKRYNSWKKFVHVILYVNRLRFGSPVLRPPSTKIYENFKYLNVERFQKMKTLFFQKHDNFNFSAKRNSIPSFFKQYQIAEKTLIMELQKKYFAKELRMLKNPKCIQPNPHLDLFLDKDGLIRCKGRLQNVSAPWDTIYPILLPNKSPIVTSYIRDLHQDCHHIGVSHLLGKLRERFWIVKGRMSVKYVVSRCVTCKRWEGGGYRLPPPPPLPLQRVIRIRPFAFTGLDYLGPVFILNNKVSQPTYVALFVCLVMRAVHLEASRNLSADEFLMSLQRFVARRGSPKFIISDNATNFRFVQPLVSFETESFDLKNKKVVNYLTSKNIYWKFIPPHAPWHGGAYERLVSLVKRSLKKSYGLNHLDYVQFSTALYMIEDTINSRPLTYVASDEVLAPLTPNHFLRPCETIDKQHSELSNDLLPSTIENLVNAYQHLDFSDDPFPPKTEELIQGSRACKNVLASFWDNFRSLYLTSLRQRHASERHNTRGSSEYVPRVGDVVLIKEPSAPRADWKYGIITELDRRQAVAKVRSQNKILLRTTNLLCPLEFTTNVNESTKIQDTDTPDMKRRKVHHDHSY